MRRRGIASVFAVAIALAALRPAIADDRASFSGSFRIVMPAPADRTLALFDPVGEAAWSPDWAPVFARAADRTALPEGAVFTTRGHGDRPTIWVLQRYDRPQHEIAYLTYAPDDTIVSIHITVRDRPAGGSEAEVRYDMVSVSPAGDRFVQDFGSGFAHLQPHWQHAIDAALAR
jgi:hypothetical protein